MADCQKLEGGRSITLGLMCFSGLSLSNHSGLLLSASFKHISSTSSAEDCAFLDFYLSLLGHCWYSMYPIVYFPLVTGLCYNLDI